MYNVQDITEAREAVGVSKAVEFMCLRYLVFGCLIASSSPDALRAATYTASFGVAENPISDGGNWISGGAAGLDWSDVATIPRLAYGLQSGFNGYDDATAVLTGNWGPDQTAQATVHTVNQNGNIFEEVELRLRTSISPHSITGYEINFRCTADGSQYVQVVRWNGALGDFTELNGIVGPGLNDGDIIKATIAGDVITAYINNVAVLQTTDDTFTSGTPGMGFFLQGASGVNLDYGFTSFAASDGLMTDSAPPSIPTSLTATAVGPSEINLTWSDSVDNVGVAGYQVVRDGTQIGTTAAARTQ